MKIKNIYIFVLLIALLVSLTSCGKKTISLESDSVRITVGEEYQIKPICEKLKNPEFSLSISNSNIVIIDESNYIIKGITVGSVDVIINVKDNEKVSPVVLKVEVYFKDPTEINVVDKVTLKANETYCISANVIPSNADDRLTFKSLDESIAVVDEKGNVTPKNIGSCVIRVASVVDQTIYKDVDIEIIYAPVSNIIVDSTLTITLGNETKLNVIVNPELADKRVTFKSLDESIVTVDEEGNITAKSVGTCVIRVTSVADETIYSDVEISVQYAKVSEIIVESKISTKLGDVSKLTANINPEFADQRITFKSLDESIAVVDEEGNLTLKKVGTCVIRVASIADETIYKDVELTVEYANPIEIVADDEVVIKMDETKEIVASVNPEFAEQKVSYKSSNEKVVKVDEFGKLTPISVGEANIIVTCVADNSITKTVKVVVEKPAATSIEVVGEVDLEVNGTYELTYKVLPATALQELEVECEEGVSYKNGILTAFYAGTYKVILKTKDGSNLEKKITVNIKGVSNPTITLKDGAKKDTYLNWGKTFDPLADVEIIDLDEPNIASKVVVETELDNKSYGTYIVEYSVTDADGNTATLSRTVEVIWNYDVEFIGHAGSYYGVQNTEEAILYAIEKLKYQCVEVDLKQTKDGVFVLCHNDTFGGVTLASTNWADLKDVEATESRGSGIPAQNGSVTGSPYKSKICTLSRFLEICKQTGTKAVIELKSSKGISNSDQSRMSALMQEIEKAGMLEQTIFLASAYNCLIWTRNNGYEYIPCQYLVSSLDSQTVLDRCIQYNFDVSTNTTYGGTNSPEWMAKYKEAGLKISTYTYTQWVDYDVVQKWIDAGVDYLTCDWHLMDKLNLPESSNEPKQKFNVTFKDNEGNVLKVVTVEQGRTAAAPTMNDKNGLQFIGWDKSITNVQSDLEVTAIYEPIIYSITYVSNASKIIETTWASKDEFVSDFYNDLFNWIKDNATNISGLTVTSGTYKLTRNSITVTFTSAADIKSLNVYDFEKTISNIIYKPVTRNSDGTCTIVEDENYFLNSSKYRVKYQEMDQWLYNCIKNTTNYSSYDTTYTPLSSGKIQIFFRMHQWMNGTNIPAFDSYPSKYEETVDERINAVIPTSVTSYTVLDEVILPEATGSVAFLGWYLDSECTIKYEKIEKGTTGNLVLYAKWDVE